MKVDLDISINLNSHVKFKLTEVGVDVYALHMAEYGQTPERSKAKLKEEASKNNGFIRMQMHEVMNIFGPQSFNGAPQCIHGNRVYLSEFNAVLTTEDN